MKISYRMGLVTAFSLCAAIGAEAQNSLSLSHLSTYSSGIYNQGGAEIVAYDPDSEQLFVVNAQAVTIDVLDVSTPGSPTLATTIDVSSYGAVANSVDVYDGVVAVAVENTNKQSDGKVVFFTTSGTYLNDVTVGALPDMLTFSHNGRYLLVANEGEPSSDYTVDPEGTISIIDMRDGAEDLDQGDVTSVGFSSYNNTQLADGIRIFGPGATVAEDLEPEYITISHDSRTAWVTLQENNAIAEIDIRDGEVTELWALGFKNHNTAGNEIDASDRDSRINIARWPVYGMYMPDGIASYAYRGTTYLVTANEGDARDYSGFAEERRVKDVTLDATAFPNRTTLRTDANLGRLTITSTMGDTDGDGDYDRLYAFGGRSFSIWSTSDGSLVYDSGDDLEQITAVAHPTYFNNDATGAFDTRSDNKGPEPEGVVIGKVRGDMYAFIGLERIGGVVVYDISTPSRPVFVQYINNRVFTGSPSGGTAGDLAPEGLAFIDGEDSPTGEPLLAVANEVSGTTTLYEINRVGNGNSKPAVGESESIPGTSLSQNYPNPFTATTMIPFTLSRDAHVTITLVDNSGKSLGSLVDTRYNAGSHEVEFKPTADIVAGSYFYRLDVDGVVYEVRKLGYTK